MSFTTSSKQGLGDLNLTIDLINRTVASDIPEKFVHQYLTTCQITI